MIEAGLSQGILIAQRSRADELASRFGDGFRGQGVRVDSSGAVLILIAVLVVLLAGWLLTRFSASSGRRIPYNSPRRLFRSLCRAHGLTLSESWLLWRLARALQLEDPSRVFLDPELVEAATVPGPLEGRRSQIVTLRAGCSRDSTRRASRRSRQAGSASSIRQGLFIPCVRDSLRRPVRSDLRYECPLHAILTGERTIRGTRGAAISAQEPATGGLLRSGSIAAD